MANIFDFVDKKLKEVEEVFKEETQELHRQIIDGSPVDTGRFKTSWQLREFNPRTLKFRLYNPVKYGLKLWRYKGSEQGWSPTGGDILIENYLRRLKERVDSL